MTHHAAAHLPEPALTDIPALVQEFETQAEQPPQVGGQPDRFISYFSSAMVKQLSDHTATRDTLQRSLIEKQRNKGPVTATYAANFILRLCQMVWMDDETYPFRSPEAWQEKVQELFSNDLARTELGLNFIIWNVGSDVETRIAGPKLVAATDDSARVYQGDYRVMSVGSARDHGLAMWQSGSPLPAVKSTQHEAEINTLLNQELPLGAGVGVDLWPLRDPDWSRFLHSCRFYPSELLSYEKRQRYGYLEGVRDASPQLYHVDLDFGEDKIAQASNQVIPADLTQPGSYDMVIFSTSLYQNFPRKRERMIRDGLELIRKTGCIVVQDFCRVKKTAPAASGHVARPDRTLDFDQAWYTRDQVATGGATSIYDHYPYTTAVLRKDRYEDGFQPFAHWTNGRCESLLPAAPFRRSLSAS